MPITDARTHLLALLMRLAPDLAEADDKKAAEDQDGDSDEEDDAER